MAVRFMSPEFEEAFNAAYENAKTQEEIKALLRSAKRRKINELVASGVDRSMAKIMVDVFFENGLADEI